MASETWAWPLIAIRDSHTVVIVPEITKGYLTNGRRGTSWRAETGFALAALAAGNADAQRVPTEEHGVTISTFSAYVG